MIPRTAPYCFCEIIVRGLWLVYALATNLVKAEREAQDSTANAIEECRYIVDWAGGVWKMQAS